MLCASRYSLSCPLDIYNVPSLHCKTGITGKLINEIEKSFPDNEVTSEGTKFVDNWAVGINVNISEAGTFFHTECVRPLYQLHD